MLVSLLKLINLLTLMTKNLFQNMRPAYIFLKKENKKLNL